MCFSQFGPDQQHGCRFRRTNHLKNKIWTLTGKQIWRDLGWPEGIADQMWTCSMLSNGKTAPPPNNVHFCAWHLVWRKTDLHFPFPGFRIAGSETERIYSLTHFPNWPSCRPKDA